MVPGILGKKIGMTQIFSKSGRRTIVTVIEAGPCQVQSLKSKERDGYSAIQMGFDDTKEKHIKKPQREYLKKNDLKCKKFVREIRCSEGIDIKVGDEVKSTIFQEGDYLDIVGISKGKGFQGGMKRCGWLGGRATHGSMFHRAPGSIGASTFPSRVTKGHGMPGHMGDERVTVQNIEVVDVDADNNIIAVNGVLPGANGSYLIIKYAKKKPITPRGQKRVEKEELEEAPEAEKKGKAKEKPAKKEAPKKDEKGKKGN